jgi:hypothetical protein
MLRAGATFQSSDPRYECHLWIIISDPMRDPERVLIVNFTSWYEGRDPSCVLQRGEHPFIKHKTCVNYRESRITSLGKIQAAVDSGALRIRQSVSSKVLANIRRGAAVSLFIPLDNLQLLKDQSLVS